MQGQASEYWSAKRGYAPNWYSFCDKLINSRITGDPDLPATFWAYPRVFDGPAKSLLEIGCLQGNKLAVFQDQGLALRCSGLDVAEGAIAAGRAKWGDRFTLMVGDLNEPDLPRAEYDAIHANGVLHHIEKLDVCVQALYDATAPGGALIASEFTGPRRYAYSSREIDAIRQGQEMLPEDLRGKPFSPDDFAVKLAADPSESIRTRDIEPVIRATFDQVEAYPYGGNVLMRALTQQFFAGFDPANDAHTSAVAKLIEFDGKVSREMPSHHTFLIARKSF